MSGLNLFVDCGSNPVMNVDPSGCDWYHWAVDTDMVILIGSVLIVLSGGAIQALLVT